MTSELALADVLAKQSADEQRTFLAALPPDELERLRYKWDFWARPKQIAPPEPWSTWLLLAGRGFGKTRILSEWIRSKVCGKTPLSAGPGNHRFIAIVAETAADARDVIVKGPAGILACHPKEFRPVHVVSARSLTWPNGAVATLYNGSEPDQLRGPQHSIAAIDELCKFRYPRESWDMLQFGMRLGDNPQQVIATTPRPLALLREIMKLDGTVTTRGSLYENRANLSSKFVHSIIGRYAGTRLGRQEIEGEIVDDTPGALWTRSMFEVCRKGADFKAPAMKRLVIAIDPATKASESDDDIAETGIVVAGIGEDGKGYLIDDRSCRLGPHGWAKVAIAAYDRYEADTIVAEVNNGGDMVEQVIRGVRGTLSVKKVWASRGKVTRAEPIAALYEQKRIFHLGAFPALEDEAVQFTPWGIEGDLPSDRVDAMVWAFAHLFPSLIVRPEKKPRLDKLPASGKIRATGY
jgi:phage terminase large subunit-like protein